MAVTDEEVKLAYDVLVQTLHPTEQIPFTKSGVRAALEAVEKLRGGQ